MLSKIKIEKYAFSIILWNVEIKQDSDEFTTETYEIVQKHIKKKYILNHKNM